MFNDIFNDLELSDEVKNKLTEKLTKFQEETKEAAQNDSDHIKEVRSRAKAEVWSIVEKNIKKASGISLDDIDKDLKEGDRVMAAIEVALKSVKEKGTATSQQLQEQLLSAQSEIERLKSEEIPAVEQKWKREFDRKNIEAGMKDLIMKNEKVAKKEPAFIFAEAYLSKNYQTKWDGGLTFETSDNLKPTIDGKVVTPDQLMNHILDLGGFVEHSNGNQPQQKPGQKPNVPAGDGKYDEYARKMAESFAAQNPV